MLRICLVWLGSEIKEDKLERVKMWQHLNPDAQVILYTDSYTDFKHSVRVPVLTQILDLGYRIDLVKMNAMQENEEFTLIVDFDVIPVHIPSFKDIGFLCYWANATQPENNIILLDDSPIARKIIDEMQEVHDQILNDKKLYTAKADRLYFKHFHQIVFKHRKELPYGGQINKLFPDLKPDKSTYRSWDKK